MTWSVLALQTPHDLMLLLTNFCFLQVLDYCLTLHSAEELRQRHRQIVESFRMARTVDVVGVKKWNRINNDDPTTAYVVTESEHHIRCAIDAQNISQDGVVLAWLQDQPTDVIGMAAARVIGIERMASLATEAEQAGDPWAAACRWQLAGDVCNKLYGRASFDWGSCREYLEKAADLVPEARLAAKGGKPTVCSGPTFVATSVVC
jgi:hypothetical protein